MFFVIQNSPGIGLVYVAKVKMQWNSQQVYKAAKLATLQTQDWREGIACLACVSPPHPPDIRSLQN